MKTIRLFGRDVTLIVEEKPVYWFEVMGVFGAVLEKSESFETRKECQAEGLRVASVWAAKDMTEKRLQIYRYQPGADNSVYDREYSVCPVVEFVMVRLS